MVKISEIMSVISELDALSGLASGLGEDDNLFENGLDSFGSVQLMLALEERFGIEFPDNLLNRRSFSTIRAIRDTVEGLVAGVDA